jgi:hypothetical protein
MIYDQLITILKLALTYLRPLFNPPPGGAGIRLTPNLLIIVIKLFIDKTL